MTNFPRVAAALLALTGLAAPPTFKTYHNARFGYRIDYPAALVRPQPEPDNGDGRRFVSADGQTMLTVYAGYNVLDGGLAEERELARQTWREHGATFSLDRPLAAGFVLSGYLKNAIFYQQTVLRAGTFTTFEWQYPAARKAAMDGIIQHTIRTWQPSVAGGD